MSIQENLFQSAIPGQSLTDTPKNFPWERPAEMSDPEEAIKFHLENLNEPEVLEDVITLIELGYPLRALSESILTAATMNGKHSIDINLIISPIIYEQLKVIADEAGVPYKTGMEENERAAEEKQTEKLEALIRKEINKMDDEIGAEGYDDSTLEDALMFLQDSTPDYNTIEDMDADNIEELENIDRTRELNPGFDELSPLLDPNYKPPQERGPMYPFPKGTDKNPIMAGNGLMSRRTG